MNPLVNEDGGDRVNLEDVVVGSQYKNIFARIGGPLNNGYSIGGGSFNGAQGEWIIGMVL